MKNNGVPPQHRYTIPVQFTEQELEMGQICAMFDLETLDLKPTGVIISLGVVLLDISKVQPFEELVAQGINIYFNKQQQIERGRTMGDSTIQWWEQQSLNNPLAAECLDYPDPVNCEELFLELNTLYTKLNYQPNRKEMRWLSRGYFDITFMNSFCDTFGLDPMMKFWCWRDIRSYLDGAGLGSQNEKMDKPKGMIAHNSLHDAAYEGWMLQRILNENPR
jgi:hypothetical protein